MESGKKKESGVKGSQEIKELEFGISSGGIALVPVFALLRNSVQIPTARWLDWSWLWLRRRFFFS
jgi:hypothetical protein